MMTREEIKSLIEKAVKSLYRKEVEVKIERPAEMTYGDYATNVAIVLKKNPQEIACAVKSVILEKVEVKNGFINFFLSKEYLQKQVGEILKQKDKFGQLKIGKRQKVNVEFISANPTGPLTLGNGRGGFCGDVLSNVLIKTGFETEREYYINDTGEQVKKLGHSVLGNSEAVYKGNYIEDLRKKVKGENAEEVGKKAAEIILEEMIKPTVNKMKIRFDTWFSEKALYQKKEVNKALDFLKKEDLSYKKEGALWFKSTKFGDDKDRVLIKADGEPTYFLSDTAYLKNKFKRGFKILFFFWGADHFGYINRIKAAAEALGFNKENVRIIIMQLVRLIQRGQEVKMSKRAGTYVTLDELIDEVGLDVARFFFLTRSPDTHLNFDLDLAKEQSEKNPVYYIQYAHARICSILRKCGKSEIRDPKSENLKLLNHTSELELIKQLIRLPEVIEDTAKDYQVQRLPQYAVDLAASFHKFYRDCQVLTENNSLQTVRIGLILATKIVLENTLNLMGISAPEKM
jgi:arginyl-tRNA synthetase